MKEKRILESKHLGILKVECPICRKEMKLIGYFNKPRDIILRVTPKPEIVFWSCDDCIYCYPEKFFNKLTIKGVDIDYNSYYERFVTFIPKGEKK
jgi:hypothetical protein